MNRPIPLTSKNKGQHAYRELKRRILMLELEPGRPLQEIELMDELALGRTPIREALQRLSSEKLVVARPRQTPFVAPILAHELAEIAEMRLILEVPAARIAAGRASNLQRKRLQDACATFQDRACADDSAGIVAGDAAIHETIAAMARNAFLTDYAERLASFSQRLWWLSAQNAHRDETFVHCHDALTQAICGGDGPTAARAAEEHVELFRSRLGQILQSAPMSGGSLDRASPDHGPAAASGGRDGRSASAG